MRHLLACVLVVLCPLAARATLITAHTDAGGAGAVVNGTLAAHEYGPANSYAFTGGGAGFGGMLGSATLYVKSDASHVYFGFSSLGVPGGNPDRVVVYLHTRPGGFQPNGQMSDVTDASRSNATFLSATAPERVIFRDGAVSNSADFALVILNRTNGFSRLYELRGAGTAHVEIAHYAAGRGTPTPEFGVSRAALGLGGTGAVELVAIALSETGFLSNEAIPALGMSTNPGFYTSGSIVYSNFHRFEVSAGAPADPFTQRVANTTISMPVTPPPAQADSFSLENALPTVAFTNPIALAVPPGETNRLFVVERAGLIVVITNLAAPTRSVFMNIQPRVNASGEGGLLGLAFHPGYATNRRFFCFYATTATNGTGTGFHTRASEFRASTTNANTADPAFEGVLFSQFNERDNHNAGDLHFGPDGLLYIATGDEGDFNDNLNNSQTITRDFFAAMLRVDVDFRTNSIPPNPHPALAAGTNYAIPAGNPFIGATNFMGTNISPTQVRTEFFATGLRNPFRFTFDPVNGRLLCADVGQNAWEEINWITNGGNYGWARREGFVAGPKTAGQPLSLFTPPLLAYGHGSATNQGNSVTGGIVYYGDRIPTLFGHYIFADYQSGHLWAMTDNGTTNTAFKWLATDAFLVGFGRDPRNGDVLMCDLIANQVKRLVPNASTSTLPQTLSAAGVFSDLQTLTPHPGVIPYELNVPFWSDNAIKRRWFSLPSTNLTMTFAAETPWTFPTSMVWIKHFDLELTSGVPSSARRLETRILVKNAGGDGGYGVTYRWGNSLLDATLVPAGGLDEPFVINDAGVIRTQVWRYPSRAECLVCHNTGAGFGLGFSAPQLNRDMDYSGRVTNQIAALAANGYLASPPASLHTLRAMAHATNDAVSVEFRARSWLQANCAQCHFPGGPSPGNFDARLLPPLPQANLVDGPLNNTQGDPLNRVIARADVPRSMAHTRIALRGAGQMPPLASSLVDTQGVALLAAWIGSLGGYQTFAEWQLAQFGSTNAAGTGPFDDFDGDGAANRLEYLTGTQPTNPASAWGISATAENNGAFSVGYERIANRGFTVQASTDLVSDAWTTLDLPGNQPFYASSNAWVEFVAPVSTNEADRYYRIRVDEP